MSLSRVFATLATVVAMTLLSSPAHALETATKWRLEFDGTAHSSGTIVLRVTPAGADPILVEAKVADSTRENLVAEAVAEACKAALPKESFKVKRREGEDVTIRTHGDAPEFSVELVSNGVQHVRIEVGPVPEREIRR